MAEVAHREGASKADGERPQRSGTPRSHRATWASPARLTYGVAGLLVGVVGGVLVGVNLSPAPEPRPPDHTLLTARPAASAAPVAATVDAVPAVDLDLGSEATRPALRSGWELVTDGADRSVALASGSKASLVLSAHPKGGRSALLAVARAEGINPNSTVGVTVGAGETTVAEWAIDSEWDLYVQPWTAEPVGDEPVDLQLRIAVEPADRAAEAEATGVAFDHLQLGSLGPRARIELQSAAGRSLLLSGFWPVEEKALGNLPGVWSSAAVSRAAVALEPLRRDYTLRLRAAAFTPIAPVELRARINDKPVGSKQLTEIDDYEFRVPNGVLTSGANTIVFEYSKMASPAEHGQDDEREMSMRLFELVLEPAPR